MRLESFARQPLLFGPSPIHRLERLSAHIGGAELWAKRDDCNSGLAFGGNKTRKLEYLVADALAKGCDTLVSTGEYYYSHVPGCHPHTQGGRDRPRQPGRRA